MSLNLEPGHFEIFASLASITVVLFKLQALRTKKMHQENRKLLEDNKKIFGKLLFEHELIVEDYCERKGIDRESLPTRHPTILNGEN